MINVDDTTNRAEPGQEQIITWRTVQEMEAGWPVIRQMYPDLTLERYLETLEHAVRMEYVQFAYLSPKNDCLGVVGVWLLPRVWCGLQIDIDNFVVDQAHQSQGIGKRLLDRCMAYAEEKNAHIATLDAFVSNSESHRFYFREGFIIKGFHFAKPISGN